MAVMHNADVARAFTELADLLEIEGGNPFRAHAYRNAARAIMDLPRDVADLVATGEDLTKIYGIGKDLTGKIRTLVETGELPVLQAARERVPEELVELLGIEQLGPARIRALHLGLDVRSLDDLEQAIQERRVRGLKGFGKKTEDRILEGIRDLRNRSKRMRLAEATRIAEDLVEWLSGVTGVDWITVAGSYRRRMETVGDLDILVTCANSGPVMKRFRDYEAVDRVASLGDTRSTVVLRSGLQVDLRVVPEASYGSAVFYFTGSKAHNVAVRRMAIREGLKINEYGVYRDQERIAGAAEEEVLSSVGLPWIPPELRENRGEIEAAQQGKLPTLVELGDLRGDLHAHTLATDGRNSLAEMAETARKQGYEYLAVTDHSQRLAIAHGLDERRLREQMEAIDDFNDRAHGITLLKGIEVDILEDGTLDLPDAVLRELDLVVCSIHSQFGLPRQQQTERVLRAMDHPCCTILGHPTARLIDERPPMELDLEAILRRAAERGVWLELNAQPSRLDLKDADVRRAKELGVRIALSSDAHAAEQLARIRFGVDQARRGWLEKADVVNTRSLDEFRKLLRERHG